MAKRKVLNWQKETDGRGKGTVTFTFKERKPGGKTVAANVRCAPGKNSQVCAIAEKLSDEAFYRLQQAGETDEKRKAAAKKAAAKRKMK
jgi:hypothetical protein